jgi:formylmethanofuran dehydrogenase subunit E
MEITQKMLDSARDDLYKAVWALVKAEQKRPNDTGDEQEQLSWAIIENDNMSFLYGKQVARAEKAEVSKCDLCLEVNVFEPLTKFEKLDICAECAEKIDEQHERRMRALDQQ